MTMLTALHQRHLDAVVRERKALGCRRVMDLGCGSGALLSLLLADPQFERVLAMDASLAALQVVREQVLASPPACDRVTLIHGSWTENHRDCSGYQAAALVETIEHLDPRELSRMEKTVFAGYGLDTIVLTAPNGEYNEVLGLSSGTFRDPDHHFEWPRA
jgi:2-polyprenyl-3-methyl-5-hydroxy-6-metoxy-1,4-benzoquinol methylase